jgi:protein SCO1
MKVLRVNVLLLPLLLVGVYGCRDAADRPSTKEYDVKAKVAAVASDKTSVTLDHEDIPGLMKGMQMKFSVADTKVLEGIRPGDMVQGRLSVQSGSYVINKLEKR